MIAAPGHLVLLGMIGSPGQLLLLGLVMLLLFGHRLPSTMRSLGQSMRAFREGMQDTDSPKLEE